MLIYLLIGIFAIISSLPIDVPDHPPGVTVVERIGPHKIGPLTHILSRKDFLQTVGAFRSGTYNMVVTTKPITLYREYGGRAQMQRSWWALEPPKGPLASRIDYAILEKWGNALDKLKEIKIPKGTILFTGVAGPQQERPEFKHGGKYQAFIPKEMLEALFVFERTKDIKSLRKAQKHLIKEWERHNFRITNNKGRVLDVKKIGKMKFPTSDDMMNSRQLPKLKKANPNWLRQSRDPVDPPNKLRSNTPSKGPSAPTRAAREQRYQMKQDLQNRFTRSNNIPNSQRHMSSPWPGGIELLRAIPIFNGNTRMERPVMEIRNGTPYISSSTAPYLSYKLMLPDPLSENEIKSLLSAHITATQRGLMLSMKQMLLEKRMITYGYDPESPEGKPVFETMKNADWFLIETVFGRGIKNESFWGLTISNVSSYPNPLIVQSKLLNDYNNDTDSRISYEDAKKAQEDVLRFSLISPYPKIVINPEAKLIVTGNQIVYQGNPLSIKMRGLYFDYYGNTYYDDECKRCHATRPFIEDFQQNYADYIREYSELKKLQSYAIFIGALLNTRMDESFNQTEKTKTLYESMPLTVIEGELIDIEEDLFLQKEVLIRDSNSTLKPLLFNNLGNEISNTDPSLARSFYIETLLEVSSNNSGDEQIKKQAVTKACSGIIWTMAKNLVTTDSDQELTNHEIKLLNYLLGLSTPNWTLDTPQYDSTIEEFNSTLIGNSSDMTQENLTLKQYFIMLEIADIVLPYALEAEDWFSVNRVSVGLLSIIEELKKDMDDNNHSWLYEWIILSNNTESWSQIENVTELQSYFTPFSRAKINLRIELFRLVMTPNSTINAEKVNATIAELKDLYKKMNSWLTNSEPKLQNMMSAENEETKLQAYATRALSYHMLTDIWLSQKTEYPNFTDFDQPNEQLKSIYTHVSYVIRSLSSSLYMSEHDTTQKSSWLILAKQDVSNLLSLSERSKKYSAAAQLIFLKEKVMETVDKLKTIRAYNNIQRVAIINEILDILMEMNQLAKVAYYFEPVEKEWLEYFSHWIFYARYQIYMIYTTIGDTEKATMWSVMSLVE